MKKFYCILLFLLVTTVVVAQQVDALPEQITQAERIIDKYTDQVTDAVISIVDQLEGPATAVFKAVVNLQIAKGIAFLLLLPLTIFVWLVFNIYFKKSIEWLNDSANKGNYYSSTSWTESPYATVGVTSLITAIILTIFTLFATYWGILHLMSPEWFAIMELIQIVK